MSFETYFGDYKQMKIVAIHSLFNYTDKIETLEWELLQSLLQVIISKIINNFPSIYHAGLGVIFLCNI